MAQANASAAENQMRLPDCPTTRWLRQPVVDTPSFVVDVTPYFDRRMESLLAYRSQYGEVTEGAALFPDEPEIRDRLATTARFYGNLIGVKYGEPYVVKETMRIDDIVAMPVRSL